MKQSAITVHLIISACSICHISGGTIHQSSIANFGRQEAPRRHAAPQDGEGESDIAQGAEADQAVQT